MKFHKFLKYTSITSKSLVCSLSFLIFLQIAFLSLKDTKFPVPEIFLNFLITENNTLENIKVSNVSYVFPNQLNIGNLNYENNITYEFNDVEYLLKDYPFTKTSILNNLTISNLKFHTPYLDQEFRISNFSSTNIGNKLNINFSLHVDNVHVNFTGSTKISSLNLILTLSNKRSHDYDLLKEYFINHIKEFKSKFNLSNSKIKLLCEFSLDEHLILRIEQINNLSKNNMIDGMSFFTELRTPNLKINKLYSKFEEINVQTSKNQLIFKDTDFYFDSKINQKNNYQYLSSFQTKNIITKGKFSGRLPGFSSHFLTDENHTLFSVISDSNSAKLTNQFVLTPKDRIQITGQNIFYPDFLNLKINTDNSSLNIVSGNSVSIEFSNSLTDEHNNEISNIKLKSNNFSVLESPPGNYLANGTLFSDFSLHLQNVRGQMGNSIVSGIFMQQFDPLSFIFNLKGYCLPTDINNWLGNWWDNIWNDFKFFDQSTPYGELIISGIWDDTRHIKVNGTVLCEELIFKELPLKQVSVDIFSDYNMTYLSSNNIEHDHGKIMGDINIPHKKHTNKDLNYSVSGDFPLNLGKKVLGKKAEIILNDFNLTHLTVSSMGSLRMSDVDKNTTSMNSDSYEINVSTNKNGTWQGIDFDSFNGKITSESGEINFQFPSIGIAGGISSINLSLTTLNKAINFNLNIVQSKIEQLLLIFLNYQRFTEQKFSGYEALNRSTLGNGAVDLSLSAKGTLNDLMNLTGSGKVKIFDKNLSEVRLLGTISKGLLKLPIPFPTGTLKFNTLEGPFLLQNDQIKFDNLLLSGLISKITNKGSFNLISGQMDILSRIQLIGNLTIPLISKIVNITDPLSRFAEVKVTGTWSDPKWELLLNPKK